MPRIVTSSSDPIDFCRQHFPREGTARQAYANLGDGPDDRGNCFSWNEEHPDYAEEDYRCETCNSVLTSRDNGDA